MTTDETDYEMDDKSEREGQGPSEADETYDFYAEMEKERVAAEERHKDPKVALDVLTRAVERWNKFLVDMSDGKPEPAKTPVPTEVVEVLEVRLEEGYGASSLFLRARARRSDGEVDIIEYETWSTSGSREEPPDHEEGIIWENLDDDGYAIEWRHLYTICLPGNESHWETPARKAKVEYLYNALRKGGVRARIHEGRLEYDRAKEAETYRALAMHLVHLSPSHNLWRGVI